MISALVRTQYGGKRAWLRCIDPTDVIIADRLDEVLPALDQIEAAVAAGSWAVGLVSYDAGPAARPR